MPALKPPYKQREALIQAGFELAEKFSPSEITPKALTLHAKLPQRSLVQQFGDMNHFVAVLQGLHYEAMRNHTLGAIIGQTPSYDRILNAVAAYLDYAFIHRGLRAWMTEIRTGSPDMQAQWQMDNRLYTQFVASEFALIGWPHPWVGARLFIAAVMELARHEQQVDRKLPASRRTIERFLSTYKLTAGFV